MTAPQFGTVGFEIHELTEQATYVKRAIHTLSLVERTCTKAGGVPWTVTQSQADMRRMRDWLTAQGVDFDAVDIGAYS